MLCVGVLFAKNKKHSTEVLLMPCHTFTCLERDEVLGVAVEGARLRGDEDAPLPDAQHHGGAVARHLVICIDGWIGMDGGKR